MLELSLIVTNYDSSAGHYNPVDWNDIHEGDNILVSMLLRGFVTLDASSTTNYWVMYKLPSGAVRAVGPFTPSPDVELPRGWMVTPAPRCLFTECGRLEVQALAVNSSDDISVIMDNYLNNRQDTTPIMMWSKVYEYHIDESILIPTASEEVAPGGGLSPAAKAYIEDLVDELIAEGLEIDSALSATSQNAVQNRVIYDNLLTQKALDTSPFANSFANVNTSWITHKNDFTDLPGSGEYVLVNARYSQNYNVQLAFGYASVDKNFYWRIVNRNTHEVFVDWTTDDIGTINDLNVAFSISMGRATGSLKAFLSTAIGDACMATGRCSVAHGLATAATGANSHSEGDSSEALGDASHAEGYATNASSDYQHVEGKYNIVDQNDTYAHIVGNGTGYSSRSNAYTLDWSGNGWFAGTVKIGGTSYADAAEVATKAYVDSAIGTAISSAIGGSY